MASSVGIASLIAYEFSHKPEEVKELVSVGHTALLSAVVSWDSARGPWSAYARLVVRSRIKDHYRASKRQETRDVIITQAMICKVERDNAGAVGVGDVSELASIYQRALEGKEEELRVFELHTLDGMNFGEIGRYLSIPAVRAWSIYQKALESIRSQTASETHGGDTTT